MTTVLAILLASLAPTPAAASVVRQYTEEFTTTTFKDPVATTADWNTGAGELRLFAFQPSQVAALDTPGTANGIAVDGDYAYIADFTSGLAILNITNPSSPILLSTFAATVQGVVASGDYLYVAAGSGGFKIVSVANPAAPVQVGSLALTGANNVAVAGDYAYVADGSSGLRVISIGNPAAPQLVATFNTAGSATDVEVDGHYVYVADGSPGFLVVDVSVPSAPALLTTVNTPGNNFGCDVTGNRAYLTDTIDGLMIFDLTNRATPVFLGSKQYSGVRDVVVAGDRAYVSCGFAGIEVADLSNESQPEAVFTFDTTDAIEAVLEDDLLYVADGSGGFRVVDVASHTNECVHASSVPAILNGLDVAIAGTHRPGSRGGHLRFQGRGPVLRGGVRQLHQCGRHKIRRSGRHTQIRISVPGRGPSLRCLRGHRQQLRDRDAAAGPLRAHAHARPVALAECASPHRRVAPRHR